ncbi:molybdopterin oxidoreductase [Alkalidesulfovibrio alkalitolerans DSM 16529]|uniref:Molybdopterin oxidoreductase n=1 Tax=Alkalidesulfovibrio alkalitolerans DSM 16529 TaxID=1121439 RepID=S7UAK2_9BACT|nr:menaquinone reductase molybdopterin-binding-like subunit QrcB [Alkalidesulfovibrio alkalitolerans]EPR30969.1 molybdopterin oxidoreductase [Alkalidesulfovibrio alkalitolerans DSM 16529]
MSLTRRGFLFVLGAGAGVTLSPVMWKLTDDVSIWTQNWPWIPRLQYGPLDRKPALSKSFAGGSPIRVLTVGGRPSIALGNPDHPLSQGALSAMAAPEVQMLYRPSRIAGPLKKTAAGGHEPISWEDAAALLAEKAKEAGSSTAVITGDINGTTREVFSALLGNLGSTEMYPMPCEQQTAAMAWNGLMGGSGLPGFDIENSDCVLALGADLLESSGTPVRNAKAFSKARPMGETPKTTWIACGALKNRTAAVSDIFVAVPPGGEGIFALGLANLLIASGAWTMAPDFETFRSVAAAWTPARVQEAIGVAPEQLALVAETLKKARRPLVVPGAAPGQGGSPAAYAAGLALNVILGNVGQPGGIRPLPSLPGVVSGAMTREAMLAKDLVACLKAVAAGTKAAPKLLMVYEANPRYALPEAEAMNAALDKAGFVVSFSSFMDETAAKADLVLPNPLSIERFDDLETPYGSGFVSYTLGMPVTKPVVDAKSSADVVLGLAKKLGMDLGFSSFEAVLEAKMAAVEATPGFIAGQTTPWDAIAKGIEPVGAAVARGLKSGKAFVSVRTVGNEDVYLGASSLARIVAVKPDGLLLAPQFLLNVGTQNVALPPHNTPTIRRNELVGKDLMVSLNGQTASAAGLKAGDRVSVTSSAGSVKGRVYIDESVMPGVVSAPLGFGRTVGDEFSKGKGDNLFKVLTVTEEAGTGKPTWASVAVRIAKG